MQRVLIAGGGIAGLSTAVALHRKGISCRILEAATAEEFADVGSGAAVQLTPNGLRALEHIGGEGMLRKVLEHSSPIEHNCMIAPSKVEAFDNIVELPSAPKSGSCLPTVMIRWGVLRALLAEQIPSHSIAFQHRVVDFQQEDDDASIHLSIATPQGVTGAILSNTTVVAADGKSSVFRPTPLVSAHRLNFKAVVDAPELAWKLPQTHNTTYSLFRPNGLACFLGPAGNGFTYWGISVPVNTELERAFMLFKQEQSAIKAKLLNLILSEIHCPELSVYAALIRATPDRHIIVQPSVEAAIPTQLAAGKLVLVGDAAHVMSASYGQCVSLAFEDAATLAHVFPDLLRYSDERLHRCIEMQSKSQERVVRMTKGDTSDTVTSWIYNWDVPFTGANASRNLPLVLHPKEKSNPALFSTSNADSNGPKIKDQPKRAHTPMEVVG